MQAAKYCYIVVRQRGKEASAAVCCVGLNYSFFTATDVLPQFSNRGKTKNGK